MRLGEAVYGAGALAAACRRQWRQEPWWNAYQLRALNTQMAHAMATVPFYAALFRQRGIEPSALRGPEDLQRLPLIHKSDIQAQPQAFLSGKGNRLRWHRSHSSGSTGEPLESWFNPQSWAQVKYALKVRRLLAWGWRPGKHVVIVEALDPEQLASHARHLRLPAEQLIGPRGYLSVFEPPARHLDTYHRLRPQYLYGFPSYFLELANHWDEAMRRRVPLKALITSAEWLSPSTRKQLETHYGVPVCDVYGSTEVKEVAWQCPGQPGYHINMDSVVVEIVDEDGRPTAAGHAGELVVTALTNRAMPLIRYATGDRAIALSGPCACGRGLSRLDRIEGRVSDYLNVPGLGRRSMYELTTAVSEVRGVAQYTIVQRTPQQLEVLVVLKPGYDGVTASAIWEAVRRVVDGQFEVSVTPVASIAREPSGKHRLVHLLHPAEASS